ncbi:MAG: histidine phosphatase family protein [Solirubrobacteraceae bacterium]|nr:histidine phosphatase family protein [Solirubrobacteraceae bacterium]
MTDASAARSRPAEARVSVTPTVLLARHGETDDNAAARFQGARNPPLNARGRAQAAALAEALATAGADLLAGGAARAGHDDVAGPVPPVGVIWASSYARARETAEIIGERLRLPVVLDDRLKESDVGRWSGMTYAQVRQEQPACFARWVDGDPEHRFPGGESLAQVADRVGEVLAEARELAPTALLVCHGGVIRTALRVVGHPAAGIAVAMNGEAVAL